MKLNIKTTEGKTVKIYSTEFYSVLAEVNNLKEIAPNKWKSEFGTIYVLTKMGFKRWENY